MDDICNFIPPKASNDIIEYFHFVYETGYQKLRQPFVHPNYYMYLVFKEAGTMTKQGKAYHSAKALCFSPSPIKALKSVAATI